MHVSFLPKLGKFSLRPFLECIDPLLVQTVPYHIIIIGLVCTEKPRTLYIHVFVCLFVRLFVCFFSFLNALL